MGKKDFSSNLELLKNDIKKASMASNISLQSSEVRLRELEKRLRRIEELITLKNPNIKKLDKKRKLSILRHLSKKVKDVFKKFKTKKKNEKKRVSRKKRK